MYIYIYIYQNDLDVCYNMLHPLYTIFDYLIYITTFTLLNT